jgi:hypothetical protein
MKYLTIAVMFFLAGLGGLTLLPARELAIDPTCKTSGISALLKELVQKERFWKGQLKYLDQEIERYQTSRQGIEGTRQMATRPSGGHRALEEFYRKYPKYRPSPSSVDRRIEELRAQADALERQQNAAKMLRFMQDMEDKYRQCRSLVAARAGT